MAVCKMVELDVEISMQQRILEERDAAADEDEEDEARSPLLSAFPRSPLLSTFPPSPVTNKRGPTQAIFDLDGAGLDDAQYAAELAKMRADAEKLDSAPHPTLAP